MVGFKAGFHIAPTTALQHCCNNRGVRAQVYLYNSCMLTTESIQQPQLYGNQPLEKAVVNTLEVTLHLKVVPILWMVTKDMPG